MRGGACDCWCCGNCSGRRYSAHSNVYGGSGWRGVDVMRRRRTPGVSGAFSISGVSGAADVHDIPSVPDASDTPGVQPSIHCFHITHNALDTNCAPAALGGRAPAPVHGAAKWSVKYSLGGEVRRAQEARIAPCLCLQRRRDKADPLSALQLVEELFEPGVVFPGAAKRRGVVGTSFW